MGQFIHTGVAVEKAKHWHDLLKADLECMWQFFHPEEGDLLEKR